VKAITESIYFKEGFWLLPVSAGTDDTLTSQDKLLFAQIISLSRKNGFCFASNSYLSKLNNVTKRTITNSISLNLSLNSSSSFISVLNVCFAFNITSISQAPFFCFSFNLMI
jgi:hypothetical protein